MLQDKSPSLGDYPEARNKMKKIIIFVFLFLLLWVTYILIYKDKTINHENDYNARISIRKKESRRYADEKKSQTDQTQRIAQTPKGTKREFFSELSNDKHKKLLLKANKIDYTSVYRYGQIYYSAGKIDEFKKITKEICVRNHSDLKLFVSLAQFFYEIGDIFYVNEIFRYGIEMNPDDLSFRYSFGDFLEIGGDHGGALDQYFKAIELNENEAEGYFKIGEVYLKLGDFSHADRYFDQAAQLNTDFIELSNELKKIWNNQKSLE